VAPPGSTGRPDVLLITIDTLRADHVGAYGAGGDVTPAIDALARSGTVFERAIAAASRTVPAHATMMTSRRTRGHSVGHRNGDTRLEGLPTLAGIFRDAGYRTGAFVGNILLTHTTGLDQGFETFDDTLETPERNRPHVVERLAPDTTDRALAWLDLPDARPRLLWVHYQDPHGPYTPPPQHADRFRDTPEPGEPVLDVGRSNQGRGVIPPYQRVAGERRPSGYAARYKGEIHFADREIGRLLTHAEQRAGDRPLVVLLTADHGESLGEAGFWFMHTHTTTPAVAHVPLVLRAPGIPSQRVTGVVGHVDVMPTLLELARLPAPEGLRGVALGPVARGEAALPDRLVYCDIGAQLSAYDDAGFVRARRLPSVWRRPAAARARIADAVGRRYRWAPGQPWRAVTQGATPLPEQVVAYASRAAPMSPLPPRGRVLEQHLRALGYTDGAADGADDGAAEGAAGEAGGGTGDGATGSGPPRDAGLRSPEPGSASGR